MKCLIALSLIVVFAAPVRANKFTDKKDDILGYYTALGNAIGYLQSTCYFYKSGDLTAFSTPSHLAKFIELVIDYHAKKLNEDSEDFSWVVAKILWDDCAPVIQKTKYKRYFLD